MRSLLLLGLPCVAQDARPLCVCRGWGARVLADATAQQHPSDVAKFIRHATSLSRWCLSARVSASVSVPTGVLSVLGLSTCSGLAAVYQERVMKGRVNTNIQVKTSTLLHPFYTTFAPISALASCAQCLCCESQRRTSVRTRNGKRRHCRKSQQSRRSVAHTP